MKLKCEIRPTEAAMCLNHEPKEFEEAAHLQILNRPRWWDFVLAHDR